MSVFYLMTELLSPFVYLGLLKCSATWLRNLNPRAQHIHGELHCPFEQSTRTWWSEQQVAGECHKMWTTLWTRPSHRLPVGPSWPHQHQSAKSALLKGGQRKAVFEECNIRVHAWCWESSSMFRKLTKSCSSGLPVEGCRILKEIRKKCFLIMSGWWRPWTIAQDKGKGSGEAMRDTE